MTFLQLAPKRSRIARLSAVHGHAWQRRFALSHSPQATPLWISDRWALRRLKVSHL